MRHGEIAKFAVEEIVYSKFTIDTCMYTVDNLSFGIIADSSEVPACRTQDIWQRTHKSADCRYCECKQNLLFPS
jgi:hypothetical protein